uniref:Uncharacterized protein n=1 Tax=Arundo donax TaxID=35708 RepID=A0A0A8YSK0_ARUDO
MHGRSETRRINWIICL